jgi:hypothetical protein
MLWPTDPNPPRLTAAMAGEASPLVPLEDFPDPLLQCPPPPCELRQLPHR